MDDQSIHNQPFHHVHDVLQALSGHAQQGLRRGRLGLRRPQPFVPGTCLCITVKQGGADNAGQLLTFCFWEESKDTEESDGIEDHKQYVEAPFHVRHRNGRCLGEQHVEGPVTAGRDARSDRARLGGEDFRGENPRYRSV